MVWIYAICFVMIVVGFGLMRFSTLDRGSDYEEGK